MLMGLALAAFQPDLDAQSRGGSRSSTTSRHPGTSSSRPSGSTSTRPSDRPSGSVSRPVKAPRPDISPADRNPSRPSGSRPGQDRPGPGFKPGNQNKPVGVRPPAYRPPQTSRPPAYRPAPPRPRPRPRPVVRPIIVRPSYGTVIAANIAAGLALTAVKLSNTSTAANELRLSRSYAAANSEYYYQDGVFYSVGTDGQYYVIVPPAGALVESLPEDFDTIILNGKEYFKVDNTVYQMTVVDGKPYFEVLGQMN